MPLGEFDLIERFFSRKSKRDDVILGVGDDAALLTVPVGQTLVAATDTLVEGRHFLPGAPPESIGHQVLAVNLSDLAAMGAEPAWALLSLAIPESNEDWIARFAQGLLTLAERFGVDLVGGDTVRGPLVVTIQLLGLVPEGKALRRSTARPGDKLFVSGWPGESAAGLEALKAGATTVGDPLVSRFLYPEPRIDLGRKLRACATAAMDVSDGLFGDLAKLCAASGVAANLELDLLPRSAPLGERFSPGEVERLMLHGGDDYELLFALPPGQADDETIGQLGKTCRVTRIGSIEQGRGVHLLRQGSRVHPSGAGYDHFA